jgi:hypothetical protein
MPGADKRGLLIEKDRDGVFSGRGRKRIVDAHGGELSPVRTRTPTGLPM